MWGGRFWPWFCRPNEYNGVSATIITYMHRLSVAWLSQFPNGHLWDLWSPGPNGHLLAASAGRDRLTVDVVRRGGEAVRRALL